MRKYLEQLIWLTALVLLFSMDTSTDAVSFCMFKWIGLPFCPGCGIGHAIHDALHLQFAASFKQHVLGIPATIVLIFYILKPILKKQSLQWKHNK